MRNLTNKDKKLAPGTNYPITEMAKALKKKNKSQFSLKTLHLPQWLFFFSRN